MRICAWGDRRYASHYLIGAIDSAIAKMAGDGSMSAIMAAERYRAVLKREQACVVVCTEAFDFGVWPAQRAHLPPAG
jgi:hypothetical protein